MCCPEGEGEGVSRRGRVRWGRLGMWSAIGGERVWLQSTIQLLSRTVNETHKEGEREREREAVRNPPSPALHAVPLSLSNQIHLPSGAGWRTGIWLDGGGLSLAARCWREAGRRELRRRWLTLSLEEDAIHEHCRCLCPNIWNFPLICDSDLMFSNKEKVERNCNLSTLLWTLDRN